MSWDKIEEFKNKMLELGTTQKKVDAALAKMKAGPEKDRLLKLKAESRGIFSNYIQPAWEKIVSLVGNDSVGITSDAKPKVTTLTPTSQNIINSMLTTPAAKASPLRGYDVGVGSDGTLGILPLLPIAAVLAATAGVGYVAKAVYTEQKILNDPSLTAAQKGDLLKSSSPAASLTALGDVTGNISKAVMAGALVFALIKFLPMLQKKGL